MAFCPENGSVFADISVARYMELWSRLRCSHAHHYRDEGKYYLDTLDIHPLLKKKGRELSKGQRRRVQTALGFMLSPSLFLFDEPFDGLDVRRTNQLMEIILAEQSKRCFIVSSHRMDVVERIADTVLVLKDGGFVVSGDVNHVCRTLLPAGQSLNLTDAMRYHLTSQEPAQAHSG
jgi:ABC-2 type transport system ATP-binding protein